MNNKILTLKLKLNKLSKVCFIITRGLGIGDWGLGPIPNPQSPIPKY